MLALSDGLSLRIRRLSLTRSSEMKEEEDKMVKSSGEICLFCVFFARLYYFFFVLLLNCID